MASAQQLPIITFDYGFSPYGQKIRTLLKAAKIPFQACEQPMVLPRPDLTALGVTYRRIPVLSIGRDVFCDSSAIIDALYRVHGATAAASVARTPADRAYEVWSNAVFANSLPTMPKAFLTPEFVKDREAIFPALKNPKFFDLRPTALAELRAYIAHVEDEFLADKPFVGGKELALADVHAVWALRWILFDLKAQQEPGYGRDAHPKLYEWFDRMPAIDAPKVDGKTAQKTILQSGYVSSNLSVDEKDPLGIKAGTSVIVENRDTKPGAFPQAGRLVGLDKTEIVLQLDNGVRVHYPRIGYAVFESAKL